MCVHSTSYTSVGRFVPSGTVNFAGLLLVILARRNVALELQIGSAITITAIIMTTCEIIAPLHSELISIEWKPVSITSHVDRNAFLCLQSLSLCLEHYKHYTFLSVTGSGTYEHTYILIS